MRGGNKKITFFDFLPYESEAAKEYLEEMAGKGWLLQSINGAFFKFKKIEPRKIKYSVDVLHKISELDHKDSDVTLERREYFRAAGWNYVCQKGKIQIFYTENYENAIPILADGEEKFKSVFRASLYKVLGQMSLTLLFILNLYMQLFVGNADFTLATNIGVLSALGMMSVVFINIILMISFLIWAIKARARLRYNEFIAYNNSKQVRRKNILMSIYGVILILALLQCLIFDKYDNKILGVLILLILLIPFIIFIFVRRFINKKRYSKKTNLAIYTVSSIVSIILLISLVQVTIFRNIAQFEQPKVPTENMILTFKDFGEYQNKNTNPYVRIDKSILAKRINYSWGIEKDYLTYTYFESKFPWIIKFDENRVINRLNKYGYGLKQIDSKFSDNIKVYSSYDHKSFVLVSEDRVVDIIKGFNAIDDEKFLDIVYSKLFKN